MKCDQLAKMKYALVMVKITRRPSEGIDGDPGAQPSHIKRVFFTFSCLCVQGRGTTATPGAVRIPSAEYCSSIPNYRKSPERYYKTTLTKERRPGNLMRHMSI